MRTKVLLVGMMAVVAGLAVATQVQAATISMNFGVGAGSPDPYSAGFTTVGSASAGAVSVASWNDVPLAQQTNLALKDSSGDVSGLRLSTAQTYEWTGSAYVDPGVSFTEPGDKTMMSGHIYHNYASGPVDLTFTFAPGLAPQGNFDMYIYYNSVVTYTEKFSILDINGVGLGLSQTGSDTGGGDGSYVLSNGVGGSGNYVKFTGISASAVASGFIVRSEANGSSDYGIVNGLQIDDITIVPEPATMVLLAVGGLLLRRRK